MKKINIKNNKNELFLNLIIQENNERNTKRFFTKFGVFFIACLFASIITIFADSNPDANDDENDNIRECQYINTDCSGKLTETKTKAVKGGGEFSLSGYLAGKDVCNANHDSDQHIKELIHSITYSPASVSLKRPSTFPISISCDKGCIHNENFEVYFNPTTVKVSYDLPNIGEIENLISSAASKSPFIKEMTLSTEGNVSATKTTLYCGKADDIHDHRSFNGTVTSSLSVEVNVPGFAGKYEYKRSSPKINTKLEYSIGPIVTLAPSVSVSGGGNDDDSCGKSYSISATGGADVTVKISAKVEGVIEIFEQGSWYSINESVELGIEGGAKTGVTVNSTISKQIDADNFTSEGSLSWDGITIFATAAAKVSGFGVEFSIEKEVVKGGSIEF